MAYYKRKRSMSARPAAAKRRRNRRRTNRRKGRRTAKVMRCVTSIPDRMRVKLSFGTAASGQYSLNAASVDNWRIIAGRQPFDIPFGTLSAINPQGWDQWITMYDNYRVLGCKVDTVVKPSSGAGFTANIATYWSDNITPIGTITGVVQNRFSHFRTLGYDFNFRHKTFARPWTIMGITKRQYMDNSENVYSTAINPTNPISLWIYIRNAGTATFTANWSITGDLYVEFLNPKTLLDS